MRPSAVLAALALCLATACGANPLAAAPGEREHIMEVASTTHPCIAVYLQPCLWVRFDESPEWRLFHERVEGFSFEEGYHYLLRVAERDVPNPPADGSSKAWRLLAVRSRVRE